MWLFSTWGVTRRSERGITHLPFCFKLFKANESLGYSVICEDGLVLFQGPLAYLGVVCFRDGIFEECLFQLIEGDDYAENLS